MKISLSKHGSIIGETQSGKTAVANYLFNRTGGLFIDIEDRGDIKADRTLTMKNSKEVFVKSLKQYRKVRYVPSPITEISSKEIKWIWKTLREMNISIYVYVDEIQNWGSSRKNVCDVFAVRGLKYGIHLISISQSPSNISKTIMRNTPTIVFFDISTFEKKYFNDYQLPYDEILSSFPTEEVKVKDKTVKKPIKYYFVVYHRGIGVSEAYKLKGIK